MANYAVLLGKVPICHAHFQNILIGISVHTRAYTITMLGTSATNIYAPISHLFSHIFILPSALLIPFHCGGTLFMQPRASRLNVPIHV